jgi:hypothetical protein
LRSNTPERPAPQWWGSYLQLGHVEEAFRNQDMERIEAHTLIAFLGERSRLATLSLV